MVDLGSSGALNGTSVSRNAASYLLDRAHSELYADRTGRRRRRDRRPPNITK